MHESEGEARGWDATFDMPAAPINLLYNRAWPYVNLVEPVVVALEKLRADGKQAVVLNCGGYVGRTGIDLHALTAAGPLQGAALHQSDCPEIEV